MAPTTPDGGQGGQFPRSGLRGANQFQDYLNELQGAVRQGSEKYAIGLPYFRSSVDPRFDRGGNRQYRPNAQTDQSFERTQELITQKYFAYFNERDPKKRAAMLRDYNQMRTRVSRALAVRRENPKRLLESATRPAGAGRARSEAEDLDRALPAGADSGRRSPSSAATGSAREPEGLRSGGSESIPPPPLFPGETLRGRRPRRSPTEILKRARELNSRFGETPASEARSPLP
jgi:hypothetical protein